MRPAALAHGTAIVMLVVLATFALAAMAGPRAQQRLAERYAEILVFPALVQRCQALPELSAAPWAAELAQWRERRKTVHSEANALIASIAAAQNKATSEIDAAISAQSKARYGAADAETLAFTCKRLRTTLRGEPYLPLRGRVELDEDSQREILDELLPVGQKLMACDSPESILVRPAPPPVLRTDATSMSALADRVEMWNLIGCGRSLDIEVSLRFPEGEPPTFALGFPRSAAPAPSTR
jgi:hypothetical protein